MSVRRRLLCEAIAKIEDGSAAAPLVAARAILNAFEEALDDALDPEFAAAIIRHRMLPRPSLRSAVIARVRRRRGADKENNSE